MFILNRSLRYAGFFHEVLPLSNPIDEVGVMDTKYQKRVKEKFVEDKTLIGDAIVLKTFVKGIPLAPTAATVTLVMEGEAFKTSPLYDAQTVLESPFHAKDCQYESLQIIYKGQGYILKEGEKIPFDGDQVSSCKLGITKGDILFNQSFAYTAHHIEQRITTFSSSLKLTSPPGVVGVVVYRPYGGYIANAEDLGVIKQIYFTLTATQDETKLILESDPFRADHRGRKKIIYPPPKGHSKSLFQQITEGGLQMTVDVDEVQQVFRSFSYRILPADEEIEIYFQPPKITEET